MTYAARSADRELIGYYPDGDAAAVAVWQSFLESRRRQHEAAAHMHDSPERSPNPRTS